MQLWSRYWNTLSFLPFCPNYDEDRNTLLNILKTIAQNILSHDDLQITQILLFGDTSFHNETFATFIFLFLPTKTCILELFDNFYELLLWLLATLNVRSFLMQFCMYLKYVLPLWDINITKTSTNFPLTIQNIYIFFVNDYCYKKRWRDRWSSDILTAVCHATLN